VSPNPLSFAFRGRNARFLLHGVSGLLALAIAAPAIAETVRWAKGARGESPIRRIPPNEAAAMAAEGRLVFVDVREGPEYEEFHLPNSIHIPLRDLPHTDLAVLGHAELVVPYCLKDFRGFEGARVLARRGIHVALLEGYGVSAWKKAGLPLAGEAVGRTDPEAAKVLRSQARPKSL